MKNLSTKKAALLGSLATLGALLLLSAAPAVSQLLRVAVVSEVQVGLNPHPRDMLVIAQGTPYTVPVGKVFVLTGLGTTYSWSGSKGGYLLVDGVQEVTCTTSQSSSTTGTTSSVVAVPTGFTVSENKSISVSGISSTEARAWGFLIDA